MQDRTLDQLPMSSDNKGYFQKLVSVSAKESGSGGSEVVTFGINATGSRVVAARTDRSLQIWRCGERFSDCVTVENAHSRAVEDVSWNPLKELEFATVARDKCVKIWRANGRLESEISLEKNYTSHLVQYSADGLYLAVGCREKQILVLDVKKNYQLVADVATDEPIYALAWFNHQHTYLVATFQNGSYTIYKYSQGLSPFFTAKGHRSVVTSVAVDPRGRYFGFGSSDGIVSLWKTDTLVVDKVLTAVDEAIAQVSLSRDGNYVGVAYDGGSNVRIFDYETLEEILEVPNSSSGSVALAGVQWFPNKTGFVYVTDRGRTIAMMRR
ncbi:THO complex subunit 3 [Meyerozyma sp. JA9]|nr:THO complex subunit 3 [Meyerozyma sp. JA9]